MTRYPIPSDDDELLAQCDVDTFRSGGKGGQHVNKTESAVRLTHRPSGLVTQAQSERSQYMNKKSALEALRKKLHQANYRKPKRVPTKKSRAVKERILQAKKQRAQKKKMRRAPGGEGE